LSVGTAVVATERLSRARFAVADELTCYYDRPDEPANVHIEARVPARLDEAGVRAAVRAVLEAEPELRTRQSATSPWRSAFYWEYLDSADVDPVVTASFADEAELAGLRSALLSQSPPLRTCPPFRFLLATGPGGDALILNAHHACIDGLSCLRLLRRVAEQYTVLALSGESGRGVSPGGHPPEPPNVGAPSGAAFPPRSVAALPRSSVQAAPRPDALTPIVKIARQAEPGPAGARSGYGARLVTWDGLARAARLRAAGVSVNDLLIAALMITIAGWNESHGRRAGLIKITMPVGDRAQAGAGGLWANTSRLTSVMARVEEGVAATDLLADVAAQTRYAKEHGGPQVDFFCRVLAASPVPVVVKDRLLRTAITLAGSVVCDTCLVSNLGVIEPVTFGEVTASQLWFSTFAHMPRGLSLGALTVAGRLQLTFRFRPALFSEPAAAAFASRYVQALDRITGREAVS
jgi:NRPS condensation-like uncharacterized protein